MRKRKQKITGEKPRTHLKAIDFFCGAGGLSYGLSKSGIRIIAGVDNDPQCKNTYTTNNTQAKFINSDIANLTCREVSTSLKVDRNDNDLLLVGCSPCQFWSKINTDRSKSEASALLLTEFQRFADWFNPGFIVIENVPGLSTKKTKSVLPQFHEFLKSKGYAFDSNIINSNYYGVPQNRKRYLLIASRLTDKIELPKTRPNKRLIVKNFLGPENGFPHIEAGHVDNTAYIHTAANLSPENLKRIKLTPKDGGTRESWRDIPDLQIDAYKGKDHMFRNVYGRMFWDEPAPTITTRFNSFSNGRFGHPEEDRAISLREGATLQTFPKHYKFIATNQSSIARQIGNAVPPALAKRIGSHLIRISSDL